MNCVCCLIKNIIDAIKNINVSCNIPQPLEVSGTITCDGANIPQPLEVTGNITCTSNIPQPLEVTGTITCNSTDARAEGMAKILSQSSSYNELVFDTGEQYQKVENLTVDGSIVSFESQGQKIQTTLCKIEYVVL